MAGASLNPSSRRSISPVTSARSSVSGQERDRAPSPASTPGSRGVLNHQPMLGASRAAISQQNARGSVEEEGGRSGSKRSFGSRRSVMPPPLISPTKSTVNGTAISSVNGDSGSKQSDSITAELAPQTRPLSASNQNTLANGKTPSTSASTQTERSRLAGTTPSSRSQPNKRPADRTPDDNSARKRPRTSAAPTEIVYLASSDDEANGGGRTATRRNGRIPRDDSDDDDIEFLPNPPASAQKTSARRQGNQPSSTAPARSTDLTASSTAAITNDVSIPTNSRTLPDPSTRHSSSAVDQPTARSSAVATLSQPTATRTEVAPVTAAVPILKSPQNVPSTTAQITQTTSAVSSASAESSSSRVTSTREHVVLAAVATSSISAVPSVSARTSPDQDTSVTQPTGRTTSTQTTTQAQASKSPSSQIPTMAPNATALVKATTLLTKSFVNGSSAAAIPPTVSNSTLTTQNASKATVASTPSSSSTSSIVRTRTAPIYGEAKKTATKRPPTVRQPASAFASTHVSSAFPSAAVRQAAMSSASAVAGSTRGPSKASASSMRKGRVTQTTRTTAPLPTNPRNYNSVPNGSRQRGKQRVEAISTTPASTPPRQMSAFGLPGSYADSPDHIRTRLTFGTSGLRTANDSPEKGDAAEDYDQVQPATSSDPMEGIGSEPPAVPNRIDIAARAKQAGSSGLTSRSSDQAPAASEKDDLSIPQLLSSGMHTSRRTEGPTPALHAALDRFAANLRAQYSERPISSSVSSPATRSETPRSSVSMEINVASNGPAVYDLPPVGLTTFTVESIARNSTVQSQAIVKPSSSSDVAMDTITALPPDAPNGAATSLVDVVAQGPTVQTKADATAISSSTLSMKKTIALLPDATPAPSDSQSSKLNEVWSKTFKCDTARSHAVPPPKMITDFSVTKAKLNLADEEEDRRWSVHEDRKRPFGWKSIYNPEYALLLLQVRAHRYASVTRVKSTRLPFLKRNLKAGTRGAVAEAFPHVSRFAQARESLHKCMKKEKSLPCHVPGCYRLDSAGEAMKRDWDVKVQAWTATRTKQEETPEASRFPSFRVLELKAISVHHRQSGAETPLPMDELGSILPGSARIHIYNGCELVHVQIVTFSGSKYDAARRFGTPAKERKWIDIEPSVRIRLQSHLIPTEGSNVVLRMELSRLVDVHGNIWPSFPERWTWEIQFASFCISDTTYGTKRLKFLPDNNKYPYAISMTCNQTWEFDYRLPMKKEPAKLDQAREVSKVKLSYDLITSVEMLRKIRERDVIDRSEGCNVNCLGAPSNFNGCWKDTPLGWRCFYCDLGDMGGEEELSAHYQVTHADECRVECSGRKTVDGILRLTLRLITGDAMADIPRGLSPAQMMVKHLSPKDATAPRSGPLPIAETPAIVTPIAAKPTSSHTLSTTSQVVAKHAQAPLPPGGSSIGQQSSSPAIAKVSAVSQPESVGTKPTAAVASKSDAVAPVISTPATKIAVETEDSRSRVAHPADRVTKNSTTAQQREAAVIISSSLAAARLAQTQTTRIEVQATKVGSVAAVDKVSTSSRTPNGVKSGPSSAQLSKPANDKSKRPTKSTKSTDESRTTPAQATSSSSGKNITKVGAPVKPTFPSKGHSQDVSSNTASPSISNGTVKVLIVPSSGAAAPSAILVTKKQSPATPRAVEAGSNPPAKANVNLTAAQLDQVIAHATDKVLPAEVTTSAPRTANQVAARPSVVMSRSRANGPPAKAPATPVQDSTTIPPKDAASKEKPAPQDSSKVTTTISRTSITPQVTTSSPSSSTAVGVKRSIEPTDASALLSLKASNTRIADDAIRRLAALKAAKAAATSGSAVQKNVPTSDTLPNGTVPRSTSFDIPESAKASSTPVEVGISNLKLSVISDSEVTKTSKSKRKSVTIMEATASREKSFMNIDKEPNLKTPSKASKEIANQVAFDFIMGDDATHWTDSSEDMPDFTPPISDALPGPSAEALILSATPFARRKLRPWEEDETADAVTPYEHPNPLGIMQPQLQNRRNNGLTTWSCRIVPGTAMDLLPELDKLWDGGKYRYVMRLVEEKWMACWYHLSEKRRFMCCTWGRWRHEKGPMHLTDKTEYVKGWMDKYGAVLLRAGLQEHTIDHVFFLRRERLIEASALKECVDHWHAFCKADRKAKGKETEEDLWEEQQAKGKEKDTQRPISSRA